MALNHSTCIEHGTFLISDERLYDVRCPQCEVEKNKTTIGNGELGGKLSHDQLDALKYATARMGLQAQKPNPELYDKVHKPKHYNVHPSGIECIQVTEYMSFCIGNAIKYLWRCDEKGGVEDLKKAIWYINREIQRRESKQEGKETNA